MKYTALAVVAIVAFADASTGINKETIERSLKQVDQTKLLRNARELYNKNTNNYGSNNNNNGNQYQSQSQYQYNMYQQQKQNSNQYNGNNQNQNYQFQVDGSFSLRFETCTSLTILDDNVMESADNGSVLHTAKDFVIFKATNNKKVQKRFAVDIPTFVNTIAETILSENYSYCEVCNDAIDTCLYTSSGTSSSYQGNQYGYQMANGGNRRLQNGDTEPIDCATCKKVCGAQMTAYSYQSEYTDESAMGWLETISQCAQLSSDDGYQLNNLQYGNYLSTNGDSVYTNSNNGNVNSNGYYNYQGQQQQYSGQQQQTYDQVYGEIYAGLMCNADGTGMEIGLFKDEDCTIQNPADAFKNTLVEGTEPYIYYTKTKSVVEYLFQAPVSCKGTTYYNPYDNANGYSSNSDNSYSSYQVPQANEGCQDLFGGDYTLDLSSGDCSNVGQNNGNYYNNQAQEDGSQYGEYTYYSSSGWKTYSYDITDGDDMFQVCTSLEKQLEAGSTYTTSTQARSNNLYEYTHNMSVNELLREKLTGDDIFLIIVGVLAGLAAVLFCFKTFWRRRRANRDKRQALINAGEMS
ncbi:unnamed protein product [Cylindrotheca closterium]|uniref:Uncharacterized protein n=1 Tax=Cylindrotheca closterium TaxID=2856 RepID=A0AAD2FYC9_9STRA|nr:unnamed protein product [Cylindrotheca closterium]